MSQIKETIDTFITVLLLVTFACAIGWTVVQLAIFLGVPLV